MWLNVSRLMDVCSSLQNAGEALDLHFRAPGAAWIPGERRKASDEIGCLILDRRNSTRCAIPVRLRIAVM